MESNLLFLKLFNKFCYVLLALAIDQYIVDVNNGYQRGAHEQVGVKCLRGKASANETLADVFKKNIEEIASNHREFA